MEDQQERSLAGVALGLGVLSLFVWILGPVTLYIGKQEVAGIDAGRRPEEGRTMTNVAIMLGIISTALLAFGIAAALFLAIVG